MSESIEVITTTAGDTIEVVTQGPQGAQGAAGPTGPAGSVTYGTTAGTATEGNDARIATIGSEAINTATGLLKTQPETLVVYSISRDSIADIEVYSLKFTDDQQTGYSGQLSLGQNNLTANQSYYMPNATGTIALTSQATDYEVTDATKGVIMKSPNGSRWRVTINNDGVLLRTALALILSAFMMCGAKAQVRDLVYGTNNVVVGPTNTNALTFTNLVTLPIASGAATTNSLLTADGAGGSAFVANRMTVSGLTTNVVRTNWVNVGADKATNDTGLSLSYAANNVYKLRWQLLVGSTWSNFAYGLSFSSTNTYTVRVIHTTLNSSQPTGISLGIGATNYTLATETGNASTIMVWGETVWMPTNAGTVNMRFWTSSSNANTSTLFSNSFITLEKLYP